MEPEDLILCPFCGEREALKPVELDTCRGESWKAIKCLSCGAQGPMSKNGLEANSLWQGRYNA